MAFRHLLPTPLLLLFCYVAAQEGGTMTTGNGGGVQHGAVAGLPEWIEGLSVLRLRNQRQHAAAPVQSVPGMQLISRVRGGGRGEGGGGGGRRAQGRREGGGVCSCAHRGVSSLGRVRVCAVLLRNLIQSLEITPPKVPPRETFRGQTKPVQEPTVPASISQQQEQDPSRFLPVLFPEVAAQGFVPVLVPEIAIRVELYQSLFRKLLRMGRFVPIRVPEGAPQE
eukprot:2494778-Rhodomonas_salina.1